MKFSAEKLNAILALPAAKRYSHFVKVAADQSAVWCLYADGWALMETNEGERVFPVWPAEPYAALFVSGAWQHYVPQKIEMEKLLDEIFPSLRASKTLLAVFPVVGDRGVMVEIDLVASDLRQELSRFE